MNQKEKTFEEVVLQALKKYEDNSPNVYDDRECMGEDFRSSSQLLRDGFKSKTFDMAEFLVEDLCEDKDFEKMVQDIVDEY